MEQANVYNLIDFDIIQVKAMTESDGVTPSNPHYQAYATAQGLFLCPSDGSFERVTSENSYRSNFGGSTPGAGNRGGNPADEGVYEQRSQDFWHPGGNGAFTQSESGLPAREFVDGLSNTAFFSERIGGSGNGDGAIPTPADIVTCLGSPGAMSPDADFGPVFDWAEAYTPAPSGFTFTAAGRWLAGSMWSNGWPFAGYDSTQYNHVAPPNWGGQDCGNSFIPDTPNEHAIVAARSYHPGTVLVAFGDAHTDTVSDDVDLLVWRSLGSRNGAEAASYNP